VKSLLDCLGLEGSLLDVEGEVETILVLLFVGESPNTDEQLVASYVDALCEFLKVARITSWVEWLSEMRCAASMAAATSPLLGRTPI
jgi:hypothetical protein